MSRTMSRTMPRTYTRVLLLLAFVGSTMSWQANAGPIIDGREWFQPADVLGYAWNDFNAICAGGPCSGSLGLSGPDLSGWTWASINDIGDLFAANSPHPGGIAAFQSPSLVPGSDFFSDTGFTITTDANLAINFGISAVAGYSSTLTPAATTAYVGFVQLGFFPQFSPGTLISTDSAGALDQGQEFTGAWLYRSAPAPVPATTVLFLVGLAAIGWFRRSAL